MTFTTERRPMTEYSIRNVQPAMDYPDGEVFRDFTYDFYKNGKKVNNWYFEAMGPLELRDLRLALQLMKKTDMGFHCMDCDVHTGDIDEYYMVHDTVWLYANPAMDGMLCVGCLEERLGRVLTPDDFTDYPVNENFGNKSERLLERLGK